MAVIVYKRRQHVINVFGWPASAPAGDGLPVGLAENATRLALNGYNGVQWYADGMRYWAVSDLNPTEPLVWGLGPWESERAWQREFFAPIERPTAAIVVGTSKPEKDWLPE